MWPGSEWVVRDADKIHGGRVDFRTPVPPVKRPEVARVPGVAESGGVQIRVRTDLARHGAQVVPEGEDGRAAPEPVAVVNAVYHEARLEYEHVPDHRVMLGVGVLLGRGGKSPCAQ